VTNIIQKKDKDEIVFLEIDLSSRRGSYTIAEGTSQHRWCEKINLIGFDAPPAGLYTNKGYMV
jgi:hypothetical protein